MYQKLLSIIILFCLFKVNYSSKILGVFPEPSPSHHYYHFGLMKALAERGHELTILATRQFDYQNLNVTQIPLNIEFEEHCFNRHPLRYKNANFIERIVNSMSCTMNLMDNMYEDKNLQHLIRSSGRKDFDLIIMEPFNYYPIVSFTEVFDCPIIFTVPCEFGHSLIEFMGTEVNPVLYPDRNLFDFRDGQLNFQQRVTSLFAYYSEKIIIKPIFENFNYYLSHKYLDGIDYSLKRAEDRVAMYFINSLTTHRPLLPNIVPLRFVHLNLPSPLPENHVKKFLDESENGVIYMSLGSICKSSDLDEKTINIFRRTFESLEYRVLWKFEGNFNNFTNNNLMIEKWFDFPQEDILAHPNVLAFINHGGFLSIQEAIYREVPVIAFPLTYDQPRSADSLVQKKCGISMDITEITQNSLSSAIKEIVKPQYKRNIRNFKKIMLDKPMSDRDLAIWNVEYVIRNKGAEYYRSQTKDVPLYQKQHFDIFAFILATFYVTIKVIKYLIMKMRVTKNNDKHEKYE